MKQSKTITAEQIKSVGGGLNEHVVMWHGMRIYVKHFISLPEMIELVNDVMGSCFDENNNVFIPELRDFAIRTGVLSHYTYIELPSDSCELYSVLFNTDLYSTILPVINKEQIESIENAVDIYIRR